MAMRNMCRPLKETGGEFCCIYLRVNVKLPLERKKESADFKDSLILSFFHFLSLHIFSSSSRLWLYDVTGN